MLAVRGEKRFEHDRNPVAEMPTSGDLKSGDTAISNYPTPPPPPLRQKEKRRPDRPHQIDLRAPKIDLELAMFTLTLQRKKRKRISEVFPRLPKLTKVF